MKKTLIIFFGILTLIGCKEQVSKFLFDSSKMSNQTKYFYKYNSDKLSSQIEKTYTFMFGQVVDSMITQIDFEYNDKKLLIKEVSQTDFKEKPTIRFYDYDKNDSLISEISINPENDTTFWEVYEYYPDGKKTVFHRFLSRQFDPNQTFTEQIENKKLDTFYYRNEFEYVGNFCKTQRQFDKKGNLTKTVNFEYNDNQLIKETHLTYFNDMEMTKKVKVYDYSKSDKKPDFFSFDTKNDTIEFLIIDFSKGIITTSTESYEYWQIINKTFYSNEKKVGTIAIDLNMNFKIVDSYEYYDNGDLKVRKSYSEEINNAR